MRLVVVAELECELGPVSGSEGGELFDGLVDAQALEDQLWAHADVAPEESLEERPRSHGRTRLLPLACAVTDMDAFFQDAATVAAYDSDPCLHFSRFATFQASPVAEEIYVTLTGTGKMVTADE